MVMNQWFSSEQIERNGLQSLTQNITSTFDPEKNYRIWGFEKPIKIIHEDEDQTVWEAHFKVEQDNTIIPLVVYYNDEEAVNEIVNYFGSNMEPLEMNIEDHSGHDTGEDG